MTASSILKHLSWPQKTKLLWLVLLVLGFFWSAFLLIYRIHDLMPFIGDQAWFYLSARDIWLKHVIPLVGITSSHTWIHQGPLWTYILAVLLPLGRFNPVVPAYFTILCTLITSIFMGVLGTQLFSKRVGIVSFILFSFSPLIILQGRMPYHTALIPLFSLLFFFSLCQWIRGLKVFFPVTIYFLAVLYNFELATQILWGPLCILLFYGFVMKKQWAVTLRDKKLLLLAVVSWLIPMLPVLIYDTTHGFKQTIVFAGWTLYHLLPGTTHTSGTYGQVITFLYQSNAKLLYGFSQQFSLILMVMSIVIVTGIVWSKRTMGDGILLFLLGVIVVALITSKTPSDAYLPMLFPYAIFVVAVALGKLISDTPSAVLVGLAIIGVIVGNTYFLLSTDYLYKTNKLYVVTLRSHENAVQYMLKLSNCQPFSFEQKGPGSQFVSSRMNTEYLSWYYGRSVVSGRTVNHFILTEKGNTFEIQKK